MMQSLKKGLFTAISIFVLSFTFVTPVANAASAACTSSFFGLTPWYKYLKADPPDCTIEFANGITDFWLIGMAIIELLLQVAGFLAVVFVLSGAFKFITAQGEPDKIANARQTIINALIGLVIAVLASQIVAFIARSLAT